MSWLSQPNTVYLADGRGDGAEDKARFDNIIQTLALVRLIPYDRGSVSGTSLSIDQCRLKIRTMSVNSLRIREAIASDMAKVLALIQVYKTYHISNGKYNI